MKFIYILFFSIIAVFPSSSLVQAETTILTASISCSNNNKFNSCPSDMLCKLATKVNIKGSWPFKTKVTVWEENSAATAAKRRGLKCGAKAIKSTSSLSNSNSVNKILRSEFGKFDLNQRKRIQKHLYYKGYYDSAIDGVWGEVTQLAIKEALGNSNNMKNSDWVRKQLYQLKEPSSYNSSKNTATHFLTRCKNDPKECQNRYLCVLGTKSIKNSKNRTWETSGKLIRYVNEAKSRGLNCGVSNGALSSASTSSLTNNTTTQSSAKLCSSDPKVCNSQYLCTYGTKLNKSKRIWETSGKYAKHAKEAKSRGLTCNVKLTVAKVDGCNEDPTLCTVSQLCSKASKNSGGKKIWRKNYSSKKYITEAKSSGVSCNVKVEIVQPKKEELLPAQEHVAVCRSPPAPTCGDESISKWFP